MPSDNRSSSTSYAGPSKTMKKDKSGGIGETLRTVLYAVLIALGVRTFAYEPFNIPSGSMVPTLLVGDYLFVSKFSYGYSRHSFMFHLPLFDGRILGSEPQRGDVAVFKTPEDNSTDYIKRIIGLPGDRIQVAGGILQINGEAVRRERVGELVNAESGFRPIRYLEYVETLPGGRQHRIVEVSDNEPFDNTPVFVVPVGRYFMMGDNRDNSQDSRDPRVRFVPAENLVGRADFLWFSLDEGTRFWEVWKWPFTLRIGRMFNGIT
jgi:signal peptidase I